MFDDGESKVYFFPHAVGRRYLNKIGDRPYDLALIGRVQNNGRPVTAQDFKGLKLLQPRPYRHRTEAFAQLIHNLNLCKTSWNAPLHEKSVTLRFVEAPAYGTISMVPHHFEELNRYYFPRDSYLVCDDEPKKAVEIIRSLTKDKDRYLAIQERAYKIVMSNHQMSNRVQYLIDIVSGKTDADVRDYYGVPI